MKHNRLCGSKLSCALAFAAAFVACGGADEPTDVDAAGTTDTTGTTGSVGATTGGSGGSGGCFEVFEGQWHLMSTGGPSMCAGFGPFDCEISQSACSVTMDCSAIGSATVEIDSEGTTTSTKVSIGEGVVADCHAVFHEAFDTGVGDVFSATLICTAQGITCEFGESKIFSS